MIRLYSALLILCVCSFSNPVFAGGSMMGGKEDGHKGKPPKICIHGFKKCEHSHKPKDDDHVTKVPEMNGAQAGIAFALMGGIVLLIRERRRMTQRPIDADSALIQG